MFYVKSIKINNFRCFDEKKIEFKPGINIIVGANGTGKTSIVEAISYIGLGKSFKKAKDKDVLKFNKPYFNIICALASDNDEKLVISYDGQNKKIKKEEELYKTLSEFVGLYKVVTFCPDDLDIIKGYPADRRHFLDIFISQCDNRYLKLLVEYKKILKSRNEFLKNVVDNVYDNVLYDILTDKLIEYGKEIIKLRSIYVKELNNIVNKISKTLTDTKEETIITYNPNTKYEDYEKTIKSNMKLDLLTKGTNFGPQKDDLVITINGKYANTYGSQGQIRSAVLSLKLSIYEIFKNNTKDVLVILDDVLSELDLHRQIDLLNYIKDSSQVFITSTDVNEIPNDIINESNVIAIKEGE